jgi:hypothetical protein
MSYSEFLRKYILGFAIVFSLLAKAMAMFLHEFSNTFVPKRRRRSDFKAEMYSWFIHRRGGTIASPFFLSENSHSPKAPRDIEIGLHRP